MKDSDKLKEVIQTFCALNFNKCHFVYETPNDIKFQINFLMNLYNIQDKWTIYLGKSKSTWGYVQPNTKRINISILRYKFPLSKQKSKYLTDTIFHEFAHILTWYKLPNLKLDKHHSSEIWKNFCRQLGCLPIASGYRVPLITE